MTDIDTYTLASKLSLLEDRVKEIERQRKAELEQKIERDRRRTELLMRLFLFGMILIAAVTWSVVLTLEVAGK